MDSSSTLVTDLLVTDAFLITGTIEPRVKRLSTYLEEVQSTFVSVKDAKLVDLRSRNTITTPRILVNRERIVLAHEFLDAVSDTGLKALSTERELVQIRAFHVGAVNFEIAGSVRPGAYEVSDRSKRFFVIEKPRLRGIEFKEGADELSVLKDLEYFVVAKQRLSYIYDFNE